MFLPAAVAPFSISEPTSLSQEYDTSSTAPESPGRPASSSGFTEQVWRDLDLVSLSLQCRNDGPKYAPLGSLTEIYRRLDRVHSHLQHQPIDTLGLPQCHNARSHTPELSRTIIHQPSNVRASVPESHRATGLTAALESTTVSAAFIDTAARFAQDLHALIASLDSKNSILDVATDPSHDEVDDFADLSISTGAAKVEAYRHKGNALSQCGAHADAADIFEIGARFADSVGLEVAVRAMMWRLASQAHECAWEAARQAGDTTRYVHHLVRDARCFEMMAAADFTTPHVYRVAGKWFRTSKVLLSSGLGAASQTAEERSRAIINWGALPCSPPPAPPAP